MTANLAGESIIDLGGEPPGAACERVLGLAAQYGYSTVAVGPGSFQLTRTRRPTWAIVLAIVFGICLWGLLFLLVKRTETAVLTVYEEPSGTRLRVIGELSNDLRQELGRAGAASRPASGPASGSFAPGPAHVPSSVGLYPPTVGSMPGSVDWPVAVAPPRPSAPADWVAPPLPDRTAPRVVDDYPTVMRPLERTRIARVAITIPDGRRYAIDRPTIVGRNPDTTSVPGAVGVAIEEGSLSKTHLVFNPAAGLVEVTDLHSTNGTTIIDPDGGGVTCEPGSAVVVRPGSSVRAGRITIQISSLG